MPTLRITPDHDVQPDTLYGWGIIVLFVVVWLAVPPSSSGQARKSENRESVIISNEHLRVDLSLQHGFVLQQIVDRETQTHFLGTDSTRSVPPLVLRVWKGGSTAYQQYGALDFNVRHVEQSETDSGSTTEVFLEVEDVADLFVRNVITLRHDARFAGWKVFIQNATDEWVDVRLLFPSLPIAVNGKKPNWAMIPVELGVSGEIQDRGMGLGPHVLNAMQFGLVGTGPDKPSLAVINMGNRVKDIHLQVESDGTLHGSTPRLAVPPNEELQLSHIKIGTVPNWQTAATVYQESGAATKPAQAPQWLREAGGIYGFSGGGAGAIYLAYPRWWLRAELSSFREMPKLLEEAKRLGTNVIYLWDYWDGAEGRDAAYRNKGNYVPRSDLGGESAFKAGIDAVHARGGRVILYVEPFIAYYYSEIGRQHGREWSLKGPEGQPRSHYREQWSMCPNVAAWQDHIVAVATRLVGEYGADGIFLDSYGMRWNYACHDSSHGHAPTESAFNQGVIELTNRVRRAVKAIDPDAVVLTESFNEQLAEVVDGSLDGSFYWHGALNDWVLETSPWKYVYPEFQVFSNGRNLGELHQIFAAGQGLALSPRWFPLSEHISTLLDIRRTYSDALIYGRLIGNPRLTKEGAVAYHYAGENQEVVVVASVNSRLTWQGEINIGAHYAGSTWEDVLARAMYRVDTSGELSLKLDYGRQGIAVLVKK